MKSRQTFSLAVSLMFASLAESATGLGFRTPTKANESETQVKANDCLLARIGGEVSSCSNLRAVSCEKDLPSNTEAQAPSHNIIRTMETKNTKKPRTAESQVYIRLSVDAVSIAYCSTLETLKTRSLTPETETRVVNALSELGKKRSALPQELRMNFTGNGGRK